MSARPQARASTLTGTDAKVRRWAEGAVAAHFAELARACGPRRAPAAAEAAGCGTRGCVFATRDPSVVLKVTRDADEAGFAAASMRDAGAPPGVVRYLAAVRLPGPGAAFALWREAASPGMPDEHYADGGRAEGRLWAALQAACAVRAQADRSGDPRGLLVAAVGRLRAGDVAPSARAAAASGPDAAVRAVLSLPGGEARAAAGLWAFRHFASLLSEDMPLVSEAMLWWMGRGVLLCDVTPENVGVVRRGGRRSTVIIDPGRSLLLDGSHDGVRLPELASPVGLERRPNGRAATPDDAFRLFLEERSRFAERYPRVAEASFELSPARCSSRLGPCRKRDVAYCSWLGGPRGSKSMQRVVLLRRALSLPRANLVAVIRHELGHLADPLAHRPGAEARADRIAGEVGGRRINYDADDIQTVGRGRPTRPAHLHQ